MGIHSLACVSPDAQIGRDVTIGPFCIVEAGASIGDGCELASHVAIRSGTMLGPNNRVFESAVLGGPPQHVHMPDRPGRVVIGAGNVFREYVTVHRAMSADRETVIGDDNLLMAGVHVAHDCRLGGPNRDRKQHDPGRACRDRGSGVHLGDRRDSPVLPRRTAGDGRRASAHR